MKLSFPSLLLLSSCTLAQSTAPIAYSPSGEQMMVYRAFLADYAKAEPKMTLNISLQFGAFTPEDYDRKSCLAGFSNDAIAASRPGVFDFGAFPTQRLVDPKTHKRSDPGDAIRKGDSVDHAVNEGFARGLFTFSDVIFDKDHTHAAFSYSFVCGALCGHGGVVVFEKKGDRWQQSKRNCGSWIS